MRVVAGGTSLKSAASLVLVQACVASLGAALCAALARPTLMCAPHHEAGQVWKLMQPSSNTMELIQPTASILQSDKTDSQQFKLSEHKTNADRNLAENEEIYQKKKIEKL